MKTVMIPTDFTKEGIQVAEAILRDANEDVKIIFTHLFHVADDIQDLLFSGSREKEYELVSEQFWGDCKMLKRMFAENLLSIRIDFFYGNKLASFKNFLEYHEINFIAYSESYGIPKLNKSSLDALPVLKKCGLPVINTDLINISAFSETVDAQ
ncbi:hypothetical protein [Dyadobacter arcticus]|uniref:Universal stress protein n=1 Tax=Dyadobacter arcticus TaxID=1078754 RepID=A0ABX0UQ03_9BACT|nr:hypothetical protein [Dyadobacter arcticus]NIJ53745.1 hypothetical protein [Dyadobacter arcticus]